MEQYGDPPNSFTLLCLASFFGILPLAENLLLKKGLINHLKRLRYLNKEGDKGTTALIWAARGVGGAAGRERGEYRGQEQTGKGGTDMGRQKGAKGRGRVADWETGGHQAPEQRWRGILGPG